VAKICEFVSKYYVFDPFLLVYLVNISFSTSVDHMISYLECEIKFYIEY
jgi:hypothetical protein